jgi:hypothetical protein
MTNASTLHARARIADPTRVGPAVAREPISPELALVSTAELQEIESRERRYLAEGRAPCGRLEPCGEGDCPKCRSGRRPASLLADVKKIVVEREAAYGPPAEHWGKAAAIANLLFDLDLNAEKWGKLWIVDKLVRDGTVAQRDNLMDIAGYADGIDRVRGTP